MLRARRSTTGIFFIRRARALWPRQFYRYIFLVPICRHLFEVVLGLVVKLNRTDISSCPNVTIGCLRDCYVLVKLSVCQIVS